MDNKLKITLLFKEIIKTNDKSFNNDETRSYMSKLANTAFNHCAENPSYIWAIFEQLKINGFNYKTVKSEYINLLETRNRNVEKNITAEVKQQLLETIEKHIKLK